MDILCKSFVFFKATYKNKTSNYVHLPEDDNKEIINKLVEEALSLAKLCLNTKKIKTKFDLIEFYDSKIGMVKSFGFKSSFTATAK